MWTQTEFLPESQRIQKLNDYLEEILIIACFDGARRTVIDALDSIEDYMLFCYSMDEPVKQASPLDLRLNTVENMIRSIEHTNDLMTQGEVSARIANQILEKIGVSRVVNTPVKGETFKDRIEKRVTEKTLTPDTLRVIAETETHRCEEACAFETAEDISDTTHRDAYKVWNTMDDDKVRATHDYIDQNIALMDDVFTTFDGDYALYPGGFTKPENNVNCRCWVTFRWF